MVAFKAYCDAIVSVGRKLAVLTTHSLPCAVLGKTTGGCRETLN